MVEVVEKNEILVWKKDTWGSFGQHDNIYTFVIDPGEKTCKAIFELLPTRHINNDSRKNVHRSTFVKKGDLKKLEGRIVKQVRDYKSSGRRDIQVDYFVVDNGELKELPAERSMRDNNGFFDLITLPDGRKFKVRKGEIDEA